METIEFLHNAFIYFRNFFLYIDSVNMVRDSIFVNIFLYIDSVNMVRDWGVGDDATQGQGPAF